MRCALLLLVLTACTPVGSPERTPGTSTLGLDPTLLEEGARSYTVFYEGTPVGEYSYSLAKETVAGRPVFRVRRAYQTPEGPVRQMAVFDARTFEPIRSESHGAISLNLEHGDGRVRGTVGSAGAPEQTMDVPLPTGALLPYMFEAALSTMPLRPGYTAEVLVVNPASARVEPVGIRVVGTTTITVPAGSFAVYEVEITGFEPETLHARRDRPHIPIGQDLPGPISMRLASISRPGRR